MSKRARAEKAPDREPAAGKRPMSALKKGILVLLAVVLVGSVAARAFLGGGGPGQAPAGQAGTAQPEGFLPGLGQGESQPAPEEPASQVEQALPYVTEASFFALIGFALGYASRKVFKLGLLILAVFVVGLQALTYAGVADVDWSRAVELANTLVFNLTENETVAGFLKDKVPTAGGFGAGYLLGFRRG